MDKTKLFWGVLIVLILYVVVFNSKQKDDTLLSQGGQDVKSYKSKESLHKIQYDQGKQINSLSNGQQAIKEALDKLNKNGGTMASVKNNLNDQVHYSPEHIKLPDGSVVVPENQQIVVKNARAKDGRMFFYDDAGDLVEANKDGNVIANHGRQKLTTDGKHIFVGDSKEAEIKRYETDYAVSADGDIFIKNKAGEILKTNHGKDRKEAVNFGEGKILVNSDGTLEIEAKGKNSFLGKLKNSGSSKGIFTSAGSRVFKNDNGDVIEIKKDGSVVNHGKGTISINEKGELEIVTREGKKNLGKIIKANAGIFTSNGSNVFKDDNGNVIEIKANGSVVNHGKGNISINADGQIEINTENGKKKLGKVVGAAEDIVTSAGSRVFKNDNGDVIEIKKDGSVVNHGKGKILVNEKGELEVVTKSGTKNLGKVIKANAGLFTSNGSNVFKDDNGNVIEIKANGLVVNHGKGKIAIDSKGNVTVKTDEVNKLFSMARRVGKGEIIYVLSGKTYFVIAEGIVVEIDRNRNVLKYKGVLYITGRVLFIFSEAGISTEIIIKQELKESTALKTDKEDTFYNFAGNTYKKGTDGKLKPLLSFDLKDNKVTVNGRPAGNIKDIQTTRKIGETEQYKPEPPKQNKPYIGASLSPDDILGISFGEKDISTKVPEKVSKLSSLTDLLKKNKNNNKNSNDSNNSGFSEKFFKIKKKFSRKGRFSNIEPSAAKPRVVMASAEGELTSLTADREEDLEEWIEGETGFTIPALTLMVAEMRFGVIAPTEDSGKEKVSFLIKKNIALRTGQIIPIRNDGKVRGYAKGEYNSERVTFETDLITFYSPEHNAYFEGSLLSNVISAEDYINGLAGDIISKQDVIMLRILAGEVMKGFGDFVKTANNPLAALQGQSQAIEASDVLTGSALNALGEIGKQYSDFLIENAKKLLPMIAAYPGQLVLLESWEKTKVRRI